MPQIIRLQDGQPPTSPNTLGDGLGKIGDALFSGNPAQQELLRQKAIEAQRLNDGNTRFQGALSDYSNQTPEQLAAAGQAAGLGGDGVGKFGRFIAASKFGASDPRTSGAQIGAGQGLGDTFVGAKMGDDTTRRGQDVAAATSRSNNDASLGEQRRQFDSTPLNTLDTNGQSTVTRRADAYGRAAPEALPVVQGNAARNALTAGRGQIPETTNAPTKEFIGAQRSDATPEVVRLQSARDGLPQGSQQRGELDAAIRAKSISAGGEGVYDKTVNEDYGKQDVSIQSEARTSGQREAMLGNMEGLLRSGKVTTGPGSQYVLAAKQLAAQLGVNLPGGSETEVFRALGNKLVLDAAGGSLGAQISNGDRDFIAAASPGMLNSPEGNIALIGVMKRVEQRKREAAGWANEYKASHGGRLDGGYSAFMQQKAEAAPLFPQRTQGQSDAAPAGGQGQPQFKILGVR